MHWLTYYFQPFCPSYTLSGLIFKEIHCNRNYKVNTYRVDELGNTSGMLEGGGGGAASAHFEK